MKFKIYVNIDNQITEYIIEAETKIMAYSKLFMQKRKLRGIIEIRSKIIQ